jgi:glycosyltransferase involved in cell wall biosynthesis
MIEAHIIAFNEAETIHLTIKHYQSFCERIIIYDNHSTDNTREIAKAMGCTVKTFGKPGELSDRAYMDLKNECWKKTHPGNDRRDWVIVVDADEILIRLLFDKYSNTFSVMGPNCSDATIFRTQGWNVFSHDVPREDWIEIDNGYPEQNYSKTVVFDPKQITDINFHIGGHVSKPRGNVIWSDETLYLFHYRNVGGPQRLVDRHKLYRPRMSEENLQRKWGVHYMFTDEERIKEWEEKYSKSVHFSRHLSPVGS